MKYYKLKMFLKSKFSSSYKISSVELYVYFGFLFLFIAGLILKIKFIGTLATPIFWTIYILIIDTLNYNLFHTSLLKKNRKELPIILISSIIIWWIFEWFNIFISNWKYFNISLQPLYMRYLFGYFWSFSTILIAVLETNDFLMKINVFKRFRSSKFSINNLISKRHLEDNRLLALLFLVGLIMIFIPIIAFSEKFKSLGADKQLFFWLKYILPYKARTYFAVFVWLGFIFLLDPIIYFLKGNSLYSKIKQGNFNLLLSLSTAGLICGFFWEIVNYFALTKWKYFVPILGHIKIFEMPVLGYLGFPVFAVELFLMYNFILII